MVQSAAVTVPVYRRDAFKQTYGGPVAFVDRKGSWEVGYVRRSYSPGHRRFEVEVALTPAPSAGLRISSQRRKTVYVSPDSDPEAFRNSMKWAIEYVPGPQVAAQMLARAQLLISALLEEDQAYATADQVVARATLAALKNRAAGRYRRGECLLPEHYRDHYRGQPSRLYLTREEQAAAEEAQKVLNGHGMADLSLLAGLDRELSAAQDRIKREKEAEDRQRTRRRLAYLMETEPDFRRLVAHYVGAVATAKGELYLELGYRLFGYCRSIDEWRKNVVDKLQAQLKPYGVDLFQLRDLQPLADAERDVLPVVQAPYDRKPDEFYYGDRVTLGGSGRCYPVNRSGREYVELSSGGGRQRKSLVQFYDNWLRSTRKAATSQG